MTDLPYPLCLSLDHHATAGNLDPADRGAPSAWRTWQLIFSVVLEDPVAWRICTLMSIAIVLRLTKIEANERIMPQSKGNTRRNSMPRGRGRSRSDYSCDDNDNNDDDEVDEDDDDYIVGRRAGGGSTSSHSLRQQQQRGGRRGSNRKKADQPSDDASYSGLLDDESRDGRGGDVWSINKSVFSTLPDRIGRTTTRNHPNRRGGNNNGSLYDNDDDGSIFSAASMYSFRRSSSVASRISQIRLPLLS